MAGLRELIRSQAAGTGLEFRHALYGPDDDAELVRDCIALANADLGDHARYIFLGVFDSADGKRKLSGVDKLELAAFKRRFQHLIEKSVEPRIEATVRAVELQGRLIGFICIEDCREQPYLTRADVAGRLSPGMGFVRRGPATFPLQRADIVRMLSSAEVPQSTEERPAPTPVAQPARPDSPIQVGFPGTDLPTVVDLPILNVCKLPSELAAERMRAMLEAKQQSRDVFGQTQTHIARLVHARHCGTDTPYQNHSDDSLRQGLASVEFDYRAADDHYLYEVRAHRLNLMIVNLSGVNLSKVRFKLTVPRVAGVGIADRIYMESAGEAPLTGYPDVAETQRATVVQTELDTVFREYKTAVYREPLRLWARENAAGRTILLNYELTAAELEQPVIGSLMIRLAKGTLKSV